MLEISILSDSSNLSHSARIKMPQFENNMGYNAQLEIWVYTGKCTPRSVHREVYTGKCTRLMYSGKCTPEVYTGGVHTSVYIGACTPYCTRPDGMIYI